MSERLNCFRALIPPCHGPCRRNRASEGFEITRGNAALVLAEPRVRFSRKTAVSRWGTQLIVAGRIVSTKVLIVDGGPEIRRALRELNEQRSDLQVLGEAENGQAAAEKVRAFQSDFVILPQNYYLLNLRNCSK
jgi:hypothetical protein